MSETIKIAVGAVLFSLILTVGIVACARILMWSGVVSP